MVSNRKCVHIDRKDIIEFHKSSAARQKELALAESKKLDELKNKDRSFYSKYYDSLNERARVEAENATMMSNARNAALGTCLKAIYISALEAETLSDDARIYAENLVDNYISEKGGAEKIFNETADRSYLLSRLAIIVEDSAKEETEAIKKIDVDSLGEDDEAEEKTEEEKDKEDEEDLDSAAGKEKKEDDEDIDKELDPEEKKEDEEEKSDESDSEEDKDDEDEDDDDKDDEDEEEEDEDKNEHLRQAGTTDELMMIRKTSMIS